MGLGVSDDVLSGFEHGLRNNETFKPLPTPSDTIPTFARIHQQNSHLLQIFAYHNLVLSNSRESIYLTLCGVITNLTSDKVKEIYPNVLGDIGKDHTRFNVHPTQGHFIGLPIPAAGLAVAFLAFFSYVSPLIMIGLALFMISKIEVPKL
ncbi:unnamed protein product [Adineta steineri]|uniref:Uncharacterized protein n=1 Tax=Adineta steineri TaxID=433720 RepID=A0A813QCE2_9BILA|nr:unnamed protein product [Adineta steineri]